MRTRLIAVLLFALLALEASACPRCTYDRMLVEGWPIKYALLSFLVPLLIVANRLDVVRVAFLFVPYVALSVGFHPYFLFHLFWKTTLLARVCSWIYGFHLVGVGLLYLASAFSFFRRSRDRGLAWWQPLAYAGAMVLGGTFLH